MHHILDLFYTKKLIARLPPFYTKKLIIFLTEVNTKKLITLLTQFYTKKSITFLNCCTQMQAIPYTIRYCTVAIPVVMDLISHRC